VPLPGGKAGMRNPLGRLTVSSYAGATPVELSASWLRAKEASQRLRSSHSAKVSSKGALGWLPQVNDGL